ncbi:MAG: transketolase C-terminal domain-containing protein [Bacilli bacterium]
MQKAYLNALYELMQKDKNVYSLLSDSGTKYDEILINEFPNQCFDFGIAEANKVGASSGMAALGKIPFVYTTGAFLAYRSYEFIRNDICMQKRNVKIVGAGSGMGISTLGPSHHSTEDISSLRAIPNLTILSPASPTEMRKCVFASYEFKGPIYIRTGMGNEDEIYSEDYEFVIGKNIVMKKGNDIGIITTGSITSEALIAAALLEQEGISVQFINIHTLKPFDSSSIINLPKSIKYIFTVEEHNILGGLGSIVSEVIAENGLNYKIVRIGLNDCFATGYGTHFDMLKMNGLDSLSIYDKIKDVLIKRGK